MGRLWELFGFLGGVLGHSWGLLGPLGTVLAAILGTSKRKIENKTEKSKILSNVPPHFGSIWESKRPPKTTPKRSQNETKIKTKNASLFYCSWTRLGPVLRRSWARLGVRKVVFALVYNGFVKIGVFEKKTTQDTFWSQLGSIWAPKRGSKGAQDDPKTDQKRVQN